MYWIDEYSQKSTCFESDFLVHPSITSMNDQLNELLDGDCVYWASSRRGLEMVKLTHIVQVQV